VSHHFDTPTAREDPRLNLCDVYLFAGSATTTAMAMTVNPTATSDTAALFRDEAIYSFHFDTDGDGRADVSFKVRFGGVVHLEIGSAHHMTCTRKFSPRITCGLIRGVPFFTDVNQTATQRVSAQLRAMALLVAGDREVTAACTAALMDDDPAAAPAREKTSALGPGWPREVATSLEMTFSGALVTARTGVLSYAEIGDRLDKAIGLILAGCGQAG
jgi:hypothetical protein